METGVKRKNKKEKIKNELASLEIKYCSKKVDDYISDYKKDIEVLI